MRTLPEVYTKLLNYWDYPEDDGYIRRQIANTACDVGISYSSNEQADIFERRLVRAISDYKYMIKYSDDEQHKEAASKKLDIYIKTWKYFHGVE